MRVSIIGCVCAGAMAVAACGGPSAPRSDARPTASATQPATSDPGPVSHGGPVRDHVSLVDHLRGRGLQVEIVSTVRRPFLRADGTVLRVTGAGLSGPASLESYDYGTAQRGDGGQLGRDAAGIARDGRPTRGTASWQGAPHWFRGDEVLVLYVGTDAAALKILDEALGKQFAGA